MSERVRVKEEAAAGVSGFSVGEIGTELEKNSNTFKREPRIEKQ